ncbi:hypothetical protein LOTGIDRAFT_195870 [Lottia gigantea]|uniref:Clathrin light chain n=1 Tax=Lottia gigantea TaxID=225164 RepID=V3ZM17_LOTGI|nr:hypothetical protein LOTGIDRAFT_195870 [Lottia gigantea]ESO85332.1 hypothetical protein LOTGIDRAFT_195870 [Lottia gigantea]
MADFDQFESANPPNMEEDPAADFLAREQDELAGLEDDNPTESAPQEDFNAFGEEQPASSNQEDLFGDSGLEDPATGDAGGVNGDLDVSSPFGQSDGLLDMGSGIGDQSGGLLDSGNQSGGLLDMDSGPSDFGASELASNGPSDAYSAISQQDVVRSEPEKIKKWREEQKERLEKKDAEEVKKKADWQSVAKKELEDWYKHHSEQLTKTHSNNLVAEKAFIKERDESVPGHEWEKICRLCEFNPKVVKSTKDVTRMRSILLQLKQTPLVK